MNPTRRARPWAVVAFFVVAVTLVFTPIGPAQVLAFAVSTTPSETLTPDPSATPDPSTSPDPSATADPSPTPEVTPTPGPSSASPTATAAPTSGVVPTTPGELTVSRHVVARVAGPLFQASYLPVDDSVLDAAQFETFRVRFGLSNAGTLPVTAFPQLEYRTAGVGAYVVVPEEPQPGRAFHAAREWVPFLGRGGGSVQGPVGEQIAVDGFRLGTADVAVTGHHSMGVNPDRPVTLAPGSATEQEFSIELTIDAAYNTGYELRITDRGTEFAGTDVATIRLGPPPPLQLSPGQRQGIQVTAPKATSGTGLAYPLVSPGSRAATALLGAARPTGLHYALARGPFSPAVLTSPDIHGPYPMNSDQCAVCHRGHTAQAPNLLTQPGPQSGLCFTCHDGTGATQNVLNAYTPPPANNASTREYFGHDALATTTHTLASDDEFGGVSNRHSECGDCHNPHRVRAVDATESANGWSASGRLAGISGVSVENNAAGSPPTYTFLNGKDTPITFEYQLCFKCHSGFTTLPSNTGFTPSRYALDKGVEFNTKNASFHPVEAAGTNQTAKMANSLAGTSRYKLWNFSTTSTIRCLNCHASSSKFSLTSPPAPGSDLAPHTSANRGILLQNYQDRVLSSASAAYSDGDFALCFVCHGEESFAPGGTATATNFSLHSKHVSGLAGKGSGGTDIDTPGAGQGNAICAECHFRIHSSTYNGETQSVTGARLVIFGPNVQGAVAGSTQPTWAQAGTSGGTCTLTCHGKEHASYPYTNVP